MTPGRQGLIDYAGRGRNGIRNRAMLCTFLDSGVRNSELCAMQRKDLNLRQGSIAVVGKGGKARTVAIGKRTKDALWRYLATRVDDDNPALFLSETGRPFRREVVQKIVSRVGRDAGIPGRCYPHRLRHTFAVLFLRHGGTAFALQYLLGHDDLTTTRQYVKLAAADMKDLYRSPLDAL